MLYKLVYETTHSDTYTGAPTYTDAHTHTRPPLQINPVKPTPRRTSQKTALVPAEVEQAGLRRAFGALMLHLALSDTRRPVLGEASERTSIV